MRNSSHALGIHSLVRDRCAEEVQPNICGALSGLWLESVEEGEAISSWAARECFTEGIMPGSVLGVVRSHQCTGGEQEPPKQKKGLVVTEARRFTFRIFACAPFLSEL